MQGNALHVFCKGIVLGEDRGPPIPHDAGNGRRFRQTLVLHQQGQCLEATTPSRDLELAGLGAIITQHGPHAQALQQTAAGDVFGQFLDGHASLDAPHVGLAQHQLVKRDIPRGGQGDFLDSFRHQIFSTTGAGSHSPDLTSRHPQTNTPFPLDDLMVGTIRENLPEDRRLRSITNWLSERDKTITSLASS